MKRKIYMTLTALVLVLSLAACSNSLNEKSSSNSDKIGKTAKKSSASQKVKKVSGTKAMQFKVSDSDGQLTVTETVDYDGDEYKAIKITVLQPMPEDIKQAAQGRDMNEVKGAVLPEWEKTSTIQELKNTKGVTVNLDITNNYELKANINIDMKSIDSDSLDDVGFFLDVTKENTPLEYILYLAQRGATKVDPA
ncbi:SP0191 family lipoprotein [Streptococcus dentasini]